MKGVGVDGRYGLAVSAKTPENIVNRVAQEVKTATAQAAVREKLTTLGFDITYEGPMELRQRIQREASMWAKLIKELGIKPE